MTQTEALKLALEALRDYRRSDDDRVSVAMGILQEALAEQPAQQQELVAWMHKETGLLRQANKAKGGDFEPNHWTPLYTAIEQALAAPVQEKNT